MNARPTPQDIRRSVAAAGALRAVEALRRAALAFEDGFRDELDQATALRRESLRNLLHYLAVRRHDVREVQYALARLGLSSLGRMEAHVLASLNAVLDVLYRLAGREPPPAVREPTPIDFDTGRAVLTEQASAVLGPARRRGPTRIMVTLPSEAASDPAFVAALVDEGMQIARDREDLEWAVRHAQLVALSFVQTPDDVDALLRELARLDATHVGVVLKIETQQAFGDLPRLLIAAMRHPNIAVMVARGDLGVEVGFERLSEVQEEILWLCEAAHVPVIWATQVLESLAKGGMPSRAEVTDAAMAVRTECVMLNKGPYIRETLRFLNDVLARMQAHHDKKTALLRKLSISDVPVPVGPRRRHDAPAARRDPAPSRAPAP